MRIFFFLYILCTLVYSNPINVLVSVQPQKEIIERIGGEYVKVEVLVPIGKSPEIYEPSIEQIKNISKAHIFFGVGMPFEKAWLKRFMNLNPTLTYHNLSTLSNYAKPNLHAHNPHSWLSPHSVQPQITFIAKALSEKDSTLADIFSSRSAQLVKKLQAITQRTKMLFKQPNAQKHFIVYHSAFENFAKDFGLIELSIEYDGKEAKGKELNALIKQSKAHNLSVIFIQPQLNKARVEAFAKSLNLHILQLDPLDKSWLLSLQENACQIAFSMAKENVASCMLEYFKE